MVSKKVIKEYYIKIESDRENKYTSKGISKWNLYKNQIERIVLKKIYLK